MVPSSIDAFFDAHPPCYGPKPSRSGDRTPEHRDRYREFV